MVEIEPAGIPGAYLLRPAVRSDPRGRLVKTMHAEAFAQAGIPFRFAEQYYSVSARNVLRGLHFQLPPHAHYKLVCCLEGEVFDVILDLRRGSPAFGAHRGFELDGERGESVFVPIGCAHGFCVRSERALLHYSVSTVYAPAHDAGVRWDSAGVAWPCADPMLSQRDRSLPPLSDFETPFRFA